MGLSTNLTPPSDPNPFALISYNRQHRIDGYNNIALIYYKFGCYHQCIDKCDMVLESDPHHAKALFRRKKCFQMIKLSMFEPLEDSQVRKMGIIESPLYKIRKVPYSATTFGFFATKNIKAGTILIE